MSVQLPELDGALNQTISQISNRILKANAEAGCNDTGDSYLSDENRNCAVNKQFRKNSGKTK